MSVFDTLKTVCGNALAISVLQNGSDMIINRRTHINTFTVESSLRAHANQFIKLLYLRGFMEDMTEEEAALHKLAIFYVAAEALNELHNMELIGDGIVKIRTIGEHKIRAQVSSQVMHETGY